MYELVGTEIEEEQAMGKQVANGSTKPKSDNNRFGPLQDNDDDDEADGNFNGSVNSDDVSDASDEVQVTGVRNNPRKSPPPDDEESTDADANEDEAENENDDSDEAEDEDGDDGKKADDGLTGMQFDQHLNAKDDQEMEDAPNANEVTPGLAPTDRSTNQPDLPPSPPP